MCGERFIGLVNPYCPAGSSPRVRGTRRQNSPRWRCRRIIPACAGNAQHWRITSFRRADHPRVCGERALALCVAALAGGSSPRVRGTQVADFSGTFEQRIIPACAGNASTQVTIAATDADHPRVCGERAHDIPHTDAARGSSPRVRGTHRRSDDYSLEQRIIPACAGNAFLALTSSIMLTDHPRVCGERSSAFQPVRSAAGSSPRVRGTRHGSRGARSTPRIIPACAGNALPVSDYFIT